MRLLVVVAVAPFFNGPVLVEGLPPTQKRRERSQREKRGWRSSGFSLPGSKKLGAASKAGRTPGLAARSLLPQVEPFLKELNICFRSILSCYSKILQKSGFQIITWFSEEKPGFQKASGKYGFCTAFIRVLYGFCTGFKKQNQVLQPKTRFSTSGRCKTWFLLPTPSFCRFFEYQGLLLGWILRL